MARGLPLITPDDLPRFRQEHELPMKGTDDRVLENDYGQWRCIGYRVHYLTDEGANDTR